jgi:uncharacterized metal-binding protein YceD (DUF177 family)
VKIDLLQFPEEGGHLSGSLDPGPYDLTNQFLKSWSPIRYDLQILKDEDGTVIAGNFDTTCQVVCARCLELFEMTIKVRDFAETFPLEQRDVDLTPAIRESILLTFPIAPKCELGAKGKCPDTATAFVREQESLEELKRKDIWGELDKLKEEE